MECRNPDGFSLSGACCRKVREYRYTGSEDSGDKDFDANQDQDDPSEDAGFAGKPAPDPPAKKETCQTQAESDNADNQ